MAAFNAIALMGGEASLITAKCVLDLDAWVALRRDVAFVDIVASEHSHYSFQLSGTSVDPLARVDFFDLYEATWAPAYGVDSEHAEPAITNEPRYDDLSHGSAFSCVAATASSGAAARHVGSP
jgi:hypothetical protein